MIGYLNEFSSSSVGSARARSRSLAVELVKRAKVILMLAAGQSYAEIGERLGCTDRYISLWK